MPDAPPLSAPRTPPAGYKEYRNEFYRFQMFYPDDLKVNVRPEEGSAATITFENAAHTKAFQIFIVPYGDAKISEDRFKSDEPSGIIDQESQTTVGGVTAESFYSKDTIGDTREVWFVSHGFLYEVTTYKELDQWLAQIMTTWQFL